jgi:HSP20 family protein
VIVAPVAGVKSEDLAINITDEVLTIRGCRDFEFSADKNDYFTQECFWGSFSRSIILPESIDASRVKASFKNGILTLRIPKIEKVKTRMVRITEE